MDYKHDIFLSYKWGGDRKEWVDTIFEPILTNVLHEELGCPPKIFKDTKNIVFGATLDTSLKDALANSACMVCVITLPYFRDSVWCPTEFASMLYRETKLELRKQGNFTGLIYPVIFVDEAAATLEEKTAVYEYPELKKLLSNISPLELDHKYNYTNEGFKKSTDYNELKEKIRKWAKSSLKPRLKSKPAWQKDWINENFFVEPYEQFKAQYTFQPNTISLPKMI